MGMTACEQTKTGQINMDFYADINGIPVNAQYSEQSIEEIFLPLLRHLTKLQKERGGRILTMLAAPPAAGKTTLVKFLEALSKETPGISPITTIGMDGFHHYQDYLTSHTAVRDGKKISLVKIKGAPVTFDLDLLTQRIQKVANGEDCGWPEYDRMTHNPREDAIQITGNNILLEGNYLLLDEPGWKDLSKYADYTIRIVADPQMLHQRLVERKVKTGVSRKKAEEFVDYSDMANVRLCLSHSLPADLTLKLETSGEYTTIA